MISTVFSTFFKEILLKLSINNNFITNFILLIIKLRLQAEGNDHHCLDKASSPWGSAYLQSVKESNLALATIQIFVQYESGVSLSFIQKKKKKKTGQDTILNEGLIEQPFSYTTNSWHFVIWCNNASLLKNSSLQSSCRFFKYSRPGYFLEYLWRN